MEINKRPFFSLIVTANKIEKYISDCIDSIRNQTFDDFECIVVDDGSTDDTAGAVMRSIRGDARFRLIQIAHGGPNVARNVGLCEATGRYILFSDGDDTLSSDCLRECASKIDGHDILIFGINYLEYKDSVLINETSTHLEEMEFASGSELADWYIVNHKLLLYSVANKCYSADALKASGIRFRNNVCFGEDRLFNYDFLLHCGKIKTVSGAYYNYRRINPTSITRTLRPHHIDELLKLHESKLKCMLSISRKTGVVEKAAFERYDICKTVEAAFRHLIEHRKDLTEEEMSEELDYLNNIDLPEYFYSEPRGIEEKIIDYINRIVFPKSEEITEQHAIDTVVVLGSTTCKYRIEHALRTFGNIRYICCGGNISNYKTPQGEALTEAEYMGSYLKEHGVDNVSIESRSTCTLENITNAALLTVPNESVAVVTGAFHALRVKKIMESQGLHWVIIPAYGPNTLPENWYRNPLGLEIVFREYERQL